MSDCEKRLKAVFYKTDAGAEPVRDWLKDLDREDRRIIGTDIKAVEFGWPGRGPAQDASVGG